ncbi:MAG: hypothetical protein AAF368_20840, partial [Planctomycetota bacterium]
PPLPWIPYFLSSGTVADQRRAELFGAAPQVKREAEGELPGLVLMADPSGAIFGLVEEHHEA